MFILTNFSLQWYFAIIFARAIQETFGLSNKHIHVSTVNTTNDTNNDICKINDKEYHKLLEGKMPFWDQMRKLQYDKNTWSYFNYHLLLCIVGKCLWVSTIQCQAKLQSLATPSDEAFCLLGLKNGWELWKWECENCK